MQCVPLAVVFEIATVHAHAQCRYQASLRVLQVTRNIYCCGIL